MPVVALQPHYRISPGFIYPINGKFRLYLESTESVDVIIARPDQVANLNSVAAAASLGALYYSGQRLIDQIVTLPASWKDHGWNLIIGHPGGAITDVAAVYYAVFPA